MGIQIRRGPDDKVLELGGGPNPLVHPQCLGGKDVHVDVRVCNNHEGKQCVDFPHDLTKFPWPIGSNEFSAVISCFCLEHLPYHHLKNALSEILRVVKPGGKIVLGLPNTEAQIKWILDHSEGWDGKDLFHAASEKLFGTQDGLQEYEGNTHKCFFNPQIVTQLLQEAGFEQILITPYNERKTDLIAEATKPINAVVAQMGQRAPVLNQEVAGGDGMTSSQPPQPKPPAAPIMNVYNGPNKSELRTEERAKLYTQSYFDNYQGRGLYLDCPQNEIIARKVLEKKPRNLLELGCGRGYVLKRLEDAGVKVNGFDISKHAFMTRVCDKVENVDLLEISPGKFIGDHWDLFFSNGFWEHIPEDKINSLVEMMSTRTSCALPTRGFHAITFLGQDNYPDNTKCTLRPKEWWVERLPKNHEVVSVQELESGPIPEDYLKGDGKLKLHVGCAWTMMHNGWTNTDILDVAQFANSGHYKFERFDVRQGMPFGTGVVDLIFSSHMLEHINYAEGLSFLRECRRLIRPTGGMRLAVPDAQYLMELYQKNQLSDFDEINGNCRDSSEQIGKLWALLHDNHQAAYDAKTLIRLLEEAGWEAKRSEFRQAGYEPIKQILREVCEVSYHGMSLFVDAVPKLG